MEDLKRCSISDLINAGVGVVEPKKKDEVQSNEKMFQVRSANDRLIDASHQKNPRRLWNDSSLIFENELTLLFASTGLGKTVLSVQMANDMALTDKVLYLDLELSDVQFRKRYSDDFTDDFNFNENLFIVNFQRRFSIPEGTNYDDFFLTSLKELVEETGAKIVFIDNMTRLISADTDKAQSAKPLMDKLNTIKFDYDLTMILLEHSRKTDNSKPITINDLQGSKMKVNFADAVFTIGESVKDKSIRYIKQLKVRSAELQYDAENVVVYELIQKDSFLQFSFLDYGSERAHMKQQTEKDKDSLIEKVKEMVQAGYPQRQVAKELGISVGAVNKYNKV